MSSGPDVNEEEDDDASCTSCDDCDLIIVLRILISKLSLWLLVTPNA